MLVGMNSVRCLASPEFTSRFSEADNKENTDRLIYSDGKLISIEHQLFALSNSDIALLAKI